MRYDPDLSRLSVQQYKDHLKCIELLPSRKVLLDVIDENFSAIQKSGIDDIQTLMKALSTTAKMTAFSQKSNIDINYLKILKREIGGLIPKAVTLNEFDVLPPEAVLQLKSKGFNNSKDFFEAYSVIEEPICEQIDCDKLYHICGLVRINGIGSLAVKLFLEAGFTSAEDIASADAKDMVEKINAVNSAKNYYNRKLGIKDMAFCIVHADMLMRYA